MTPVPNRRAQQKEATRERVFLTAMELFQEHGYEAINIDKIVRAANVARGTFYFHFPSKDDVLLEAVRRAEASTATRMCESRGGTIRDSLTATTAGFAEAWQQRRELLMHASAVALRRIAAVEQEREEEPLRLELVVHVDAAVARGEIRSDLPSQMLADMFLLNVFGALMGWAATGEHDLQLVMGAVIDLFLRGAQG